MDVEERWVSRRLRGRVIAAVGTVVLTCLLALPASGAAATWTFGYTGGMQTWVVPAGVTSAHFDLYGAHGGGAGTSLGDFKGGKGGRAQAELHGLTPGSTVYIVVGGEGGFRRAGFNGGGSGDRDGGGGATDIRIGGTGLYHRVVVAGGGGGAGQAAGDRAGDGGGLTGTAGSGGLGLGGGGGTQTDGGSSPHQRGRGSFGQGGASSICSLIYGCTGGGGGGGWYGGGGGPSGGGGGSGHGPADTDFSTGVSGGNGSVTITVVTRPQTGPYHGSSPRGPITFHLSHDYATVTNFTVEGQVLVHVARFHFGGTNPGSFSASQGNWHAWGQWSADRLGYVRGGYSYDAGGHRIEVGWSAVAIHPG